MCGPVSLSWDDDLLSSQVNVDHRQSVDVGRGWFAEFLVHVCRVGQFHLLLCSAKTFSNAIFSSITLEKPFGTFGEGGSPMVWIWVEGRECFMREIFCKIFVKFFTRIFLKILRKICEIFAQISSWKFSQILNFEKCSRTCPLSSAYDTNIFCTFASQCFVSC